MNTRDQFGAYLLLKKLSEDALGETFRAGRVARQTLERVVLLRVLNGTGFDAERIARSLQQRAELAKALKSPTIAGAVDVGQVRGVPYVAYDYSAGRSLAQLLEQAANRNNPLPLDHALLIAERVALALAVAQETRIGDERVQHGFVTPQLVQVSNEGELKLVGFEASTGLRSSASNPVVKQAVGRYLAPETLAGQPPSRADDVWSVGAILLEMLTGQPVPAVPADALAGVIDQALVAADGTAIPSELAALLKRSLAPREQRVPDIVAWHKSLAAWMSSAGQAATTFNLAFFLHSLFRDDIERESREIESEKTQAAALAATATAPAPEPAKGAAVAGTAPRASGPIREDTAVVRDEYGIPPKKSNTPMIAGAVGALVVLGVGGWFVFGRGGGETPSPQTQAPAAAPAVVETPAAAEPEVPAGPTPEELQQQISEMIAQQSKQVEAGIQARYEEQLKALQSQLAAAERAKIESEQRAAQQAAAQLVQKAEPEPTPAPVEPTRTVATQQPATPEPAPARAAATTPTPAPQATRPAPSPPKPVQPAPQPSVRRGELVTMGSGVVPPRIVRPASLSYPPLAKRTKKEASVIVRVLVDENGDVIDTDIPGGKVGFGFDAAAISYAKGSKWDPARKEGVEVKIWTEIKVDFKL